MRADAWLAGVLLGGLGFAASLRFLQRNKVFGWRRLVLASFVHVVGIALLLNTLNTYGLPQLLFPKCSAGGWLSTSCWNYEDPAVRQLALALHDWQMANLIWRFMVIFGLLADVLAIWYVIYLCQLVLRRRAARTAVERASR